MCIRDRVRPGFLNISVQDEFLADYAEQMYHDKFKGIPQAEAEETIVLDYGNPCLLYTSIRKQYRYN